MNSLRLRLCLALLVVIVPRLHAAVADVRFKDLTTTATTPAADDYLAIDGATNGTRKILAPRFLSNATTSWSGVANITTTGNFSGNNLSGTNTGDQNIFKNIVVSGQNTVTANSTTGNLTLAAGANVTITTNNTTNTITIDSSGGGGGGGSGNVTGAGVTGNIVVWSNATNVTATGIVWNGTNSSATLGNIVLYGNGTFTTNTINTTDLNVTNPIPGAAGGTGVSNSGKTITLGGNLTTTGAYAANIIFSATTNATVPPGTVSLGFRNIPQNTQTANYTTVAEDVGKMIIHTSAASGNHTFTVNNTASADGDAISFLNAKTGTTVTLTLSSGNFTLYQGNLTATGANASVPAGSIATVYRIATGDWAISGAGVTVP